MTLKEARLLDIYVWDICFDQTSFKGHIFGNFVPKSVLIIGYNSQVQSLMKDFLYLNVRDVIEISS